MGGHSVCNKSTDSLEGDVMAGPVHITVNCSSGLERIRNVYEAVQNVGHGTVLHGLSHFFFRYSHNGL